jgi:hypothetical protein
LRGLRGLRIRSAIEYSRRYQATENPAQGDHAADGD